MIRTVDRFAQRNAHLDYEQPAPQGQQAADPTPQAPTVRTADAYLDRLRQQAASLRRWLR